MERETEVQSASSQEQIKDKFYELHPAATERYSVDQNNLHRGLDLPGKHTQFIKPEKRPLKGQEALDVLIAKKPAVKRQKTQPFRKCQRVKMPKQKLGSEHSIEGIHNPFQELKISDDRLNEIQGASAPWYYGDPYGSTSDVSSASLQEKE
ncbi:hypothetical protein AYI68_g3595 [Smittium mucronatum]|uniref:Uncharacterized protein n=1 Tax=Smittium mucronatum TaxID=133383 RepID=A0A1R0GZG0_9FUNG|nr:hypothetical protein AYI68_g3595 [Smittium mucronatum]